MVSQLITVILAGICLVNLSDGKGMAHCWEILRFIFVSPFQRRKSVARYNHQTIYSDAKRVRSFGKCKSSLS